MFRRRICEANYRGLLSEATAAKPQSRQSRRGGRYDWLIAPSVEREVRARLFDDASEQAIKMFEINLAASCSRP
ncbi:MAG: hypothetical protein ACLS4Z_09640 [Christensenellaceae bacterium]